MSACSLPIWCLCPFSLVQASFSRVFPSVVWGTRAQVCTRGRKLRDRDRHPQAGACHASCARAQRSHLEGIRLQDREPRPLGCGTLRLQSLESTCPCLARLGPGQPQCDGQTLGTTTSQVCRAEIQALPSPSAPVSARLCLAGGLSSVKWAQQVNPCPSSVFTSVFLNFLLLLSCFFYS